MPSCLLTFCLPTCLLPTRPSQAFNTLRQPPRLATPKPFPTFMVDTTSPTLYLLKAENSEVFGPVDFRSTHRLGRPQPRSARSTRFPVIRNTWFKAPMVPQLGMDYLIELTSEQLYGPTTLGAIQEFINLGEVHADTNIINAKDGTQRSSSATSRTCPCRRLAPPPRWRNPRATRFVPASAPASSSASANWSTPSLRSAAPWTPWKNATSAWKRSTPELLNQRSA